MLLRYLPRFKIKWDTLWSIGILKTPYCFNYHIYYPWNQLLIQQMILAYIFMHVGLFYFWNATKHLSQTMFAYFIICKEYVLLLKHNWACCYLLLNTRHKYYNQIFYLITKDLNDLLRAPSDNLKFISTHLKLLSSHLFRSSLSL